MDKVPRPIPQGTVDPEDFARLEQLIVHGWTPEEMDVFLRVLSASAIWMWNLPSVLSLGGTRAWVERKYACPVKLAFTYSRMRFFTTSIRTGYKPPKNFLRAVRKVDPNDPAYQ